MAQFSVQNEWKCSITNAILVVIAYVILIKLLGDGAGAPFDSARNWWTSQEVLLFVGAVIAFKVNEMVFGSCNL